MHQRKEVAKTKVYERDENKKRRYPFKFSRKKIWDNFYFKE